MSFKAISNLIAAHREWDKTMQDLQQGISASRRAAERNMRSSTLYQRSPKPKSSKGLNRKTSLNAARSRNGNKLTVALEIDEKQQGYIKQHQLWLEQAVTHFES